MRVERFTAWVIPAGVGVAVGPGVPVGPGVAVGPGVPVGPGVAVPPGVDVGVAVAVGVGVGVAGQLPFTLNTMCMFGKPIVAVSVGVVIPHVAALR
jgi:UDP-3-O-[3-hydroxymyristoyl] glucosamine N-acyltransferase